jgi:transposase
MGIGSGKNNMKSLATFVGRVTCVLSGGIRRVELYRQYKKGEGIVADMNKEFCKGFEVGQEFRVRVLKEKGKPAWLEVKKLKPKKLDKKKIARILERIQKTLKDIDFV